MEAIEIARLCAKYADDKKAENIVLLDLRGLSPVTDYFVIVTAGSNPQLRAVRDEIVDQMRDEHEVRALFTNGTYESQWLIVNYPNVLVHVQSPEKREFYSLEELWGDAPKLDWEDKKPVAAPAIKEKKRPTKKAAGKRAAAKKTPAKKSAVKKTAAKKAAQKR